MWQKLKNLISKAWANIKADLERNLQATKAFIWCNTAISIVANWIEERMGKLVKWAERRVHDWRVNQGKLLAEQEGKKVADLENRLLQLKSEQRRIEHQLSGK